MVRQAHHKFKLAAAFGHNGFSRLLRDPAMAGQDRLKAEGGGFEPPRGFPQLVFKTSAIGRSANPPRLKS